MKKIAALQGITIYGLEAGTRLAKRLGFFGEADRYKAAADSIRKAAYDLLYDKKRKVFSGDENNAQLSWASQIWMVLAEVLDKEESKRLITHMLENRKDFIQPVTPLSLSLCC